MKPLSSNLRLLRMLFCMILPAAIFMAHGCASTEMTEKIPEMVWPLPPEKPRIKFVDIILGSADTRTKGQLITKVLTGSDSDMKFVKPFGVAARDSRMYVTDIGSIHAYDFQKQTFGLMGTSILKGPTAIAATDNRIYVAEATKRKIYLLDTKGDLKGEFGWDVVGTVGGIAVDEKNSRLVISDSRKHAIHFFDLEGKYQSSFGKRGKAPGDLNFPYSVAVDRQGRIYVVDAGNFRIEIFDETGNFIKAFGSVGTTAGFFARPKSISLDSDGHIYVLDAAFGNFQIFDFEGNSLLAVGNSGFETAEFSLPSSIFIDEKDEIYVVDQMNARVQIFRYLKDQ